MNRWNTQFDAALRRVYGLSSEEAGLDPLALLQWRALHPCEPEHAVWAYGESLKLEPMESVLGQPAAQEAEQQLDAAVAAYSEASGLTGPVSTYLAHRRGIAAALRGGA